jgi:glutathione S-transferase
MSDMLKLYHATNSPNSRRVRIFLAEKGLKPTLIAVDLGAGEQHSDAYRAINPRRVVPALVLEDGTTIGEVPAIMRYLDEAFPETPLLGVTPKEKGLVTMWERFAGGLRPGDGRRAQQGPEAARSRHRRPARL